MRTYFIILFGSVLFTSCTKWEDDPCKHQRGEKGKLEKAILPFHHLEINQHLPCTILYSDTPKVVLYGPSGSLPFISIEVENDTLKLKNKNRCSWLRNYDQTLSVEIYTPYLNSIKQNGSADLSISKPFYTPKLTFYAEYYSGNVTFENLETDTLLAWVNSSGSAYFDLKGKSNYAYLFIRGSSQINGLELETETAHLVSYSNGDIQLKAPNQTIIAEIRYNGNVEVSQRPPHEKIVITGSGKYIHP